MDTAVHAPAVPRLSPARIVGTSLLSLLALLMIAVGIIGLWARLGTSDRGYVTSGTHPYTTAGRAIVSGSLDADGIPDWLVAKLRVTASSGDRQPLFVGVARKADVDRYLAGVAHSTVEDVNFDPFDATYSSTGGTAVPARPT